MVKYYSLIEITGHSKEILKTAEYENPCQAASMLIEETKRILLGYYGIQEEPFLGKITLSDKRGDLEEISYLGNIDISAFYRQCKFFLSDTVKKDINKDLMKKRLPLVLAHTHFLDTLDDTYASTIKLLNSLDEFSTISLGAEKGFSFTPRFGLYFNKYKDCLKDELDKYGKLNTSKEWWLLHQYGHELRRLLDLHFTGEFYEPLSMSRADIEFVRLFGDICANMKGRSLPYKNQHFRKLKDEAEIETNKMFNYNKYGKPSDYIISLISNTWDAV